MNKMLRTNVPSSSLIVGCIEREFIIREGGGGRIVFDAVAVFITRCILGSFRNFVIYMLLS